MSDTIRVRLAVQGDGVVPYNAPVGMTLGELKTMMDINPHLEMRLGGNTVNDDFVINEDTVKPGDARAGFKGVEYLFPYDYDKHQLAEQLARHKLTQVLHNLPAGNWAGGERGIGCHPDRVGEFQDGVAKAIDYARALGCRQLNCLAGLAPAGVAPELLRATFVSNLRFAADQLKQAGIKLLTEPINSIRDMPGFYLDTTRQALDIIAEVGSDNLFIQYDIYHMQVMEGDLANTIEKNLQLIPHMQLADTPGRNEPGTGRSTTRSYSTTLTGSVMLDG